MSIAAVAHRHVFGLKGDVKDNVAFADEQAVIYPAGANSILYNTENKQQRFIPVTEKGEGITAMALSPNRRYIAIAERSEKPILLIYDLHTLRKRKVLHPPDSTSKEFVSLAFSGDSKYIITQTGAPDWTLYYWAWEKAKLMGSVRTVTTTMLAASVLSGIIGSGSTPVGAASEHMVRESMSVAIKERRETIGEKAEKKEDDANEDDSPETTAAPATNAPAVAPAPITNGAALTLGQSGPSGSSKEHFGAVVYQALFNPGDSTHISVVGNGIFRLYRYTEGVFKIAGGQKIEAKNYLAHCWISEDRIVVGAEDAKIFIIQGNGDLLFDLSNLHGPTDVPRAIHSLVPHSKGFIAGGAGGSIVMYEKIEDPMSVTKEFYRKLKEFTLQDESVRVLNMALSPSEDTLVLTSENNQMFSVALAASDIKGDDTKYEVQAQPFHHGQILGMDTCIRKPLIVTCSSDKSVRVWNYLENSSELVKYFSEEAFSVSIHPSGLYILVGFNDKLRLMNLLIDDIRPFKEFSIRGCRECRFSNGGQYFAAVHGNTIQIFSTWSFENLGTLKGHNGKVRSIAWSSDDSKIISAGMDGAIYDWALRDLMQPNGTGIKRDGENILKTCAYSCAVTSPDGKSIFAVGSDKTLKELTDSQITKEIPADAYFTQICLSHSGRMMFLGTSSGTVRAVKFPLTTDPSDFQEHQAHSAPVTKLRVSFDDQFLFSSSEDGCLYVFKISDKESSRNKREREIVYADEILVTKTDLEEKSTLMSELRQRVDEMKMENEYQLRLKDLNFNEKIKEMTEKFMQEVEALKITSTVLRTEKEKEEVRFEEEVDEEKERHTRELMDLETTHNSKLMAEYEKYQELQIKTAEQQAQWEAQMREMQDSQERNLTELTEHFELKIKEKQVEIDALQQDMENQLREYEETTKETEEDADEEVLELKHRYERRLREEKEIGLRLKGENGIMKKKFNTLSSEIEAHKSEIARAFSEEKRLQSVIKSLERDVAGLKKEIQERDETIQDKEKRIYDLKKKNQELEKFKFVLDYKIRELKKQIEPREQDILGMTAQIKAMDIELQQYHKINGQLELQITDLRLKLKAAEKEVAKERQKVRAASAIVKRFKVDLNECIQYIQDPKNLKSSLKKLYQKYCLTAHGLLQPTRGALSATAGGSASQESLVPGSGDNDVEVDVQLELARQREHMERTVASLRRKVVKDQHTHRQDNIRIMSENVTLIKEINSLRRDFKGSKMREAAAMQAQDTGLSMALSQSSSTGKLPGLPAKSPLPTGGAGAGA